jgi:hypothetical protein
MYIIDKNEFKTKKECCDYTRKLINSLGIKTIPKNDKHYNYLLSLLSKHPDYDDIITLGTINSFFLAPNPLYKNNLETNINFDNGLTYNFSWVSASNFKPKNIKASIKSIFRHGIKYQINDFRDTIKSYKCEMCNDTNANTNYEIDHINTFQSLVDDYFILYPNHPIKFTKDTETNITTFFKEDMHYLINFQEYHKKNANLRVLCKQCNLSRNKKV